MRNAHRLGFRIVVCVLGFFLSSILIAPIAVYADTGEDFSDLRIDPGEYYFVSLSLDTGDSLYSRFHVTYGDGIYFFIVDQDGHDDILAGRVAETAYEENTYYAEGGIWRYVDFTAPHDSVWHVWFSKVYGAPLSGSAATIEGHVRQDTDGPSIVEFNVLEDPVVGTVEIHYRVLDQGYPVASISLRVNQSDVVRLEDPEQTHYTVGFEATGKLVWDSTTSSNGNCTLDLVARDSLGHVTFSSGVSVEVENGFWDYPNNIVSVAGLVVMLVLVICYCRTRR